MSHSEEVIVLTAADFSEARRCGHLDLRGHRCLNTKNHRGRHSPSRYKYKGEVMGACTHNINDSDHCRGCENDLRKHVGSLQAQVDQLVVERADAKVAISTLTFERDVLQRKVDYLLERSGKEKT